MAMTADEFEQYQEATGARELSVILDKEPKKPRKRANGKATASTPTSEKTNTVPLTEVQFSKLWELITGGRVIVVQDETGLTFLVSTESLIKAVPALLATL